MGDETLPEGPEVCFSSRLKGNQLSQEFCWLLNLSKKLVNCSQCTRTIEMDLYQNVVPSPR